MELDEPHAAHVCGQVENVPRVLYCRTAGHEFLQVERPVLDLRKELIPLVERLDIHRTNTCMAPPPEFGNDMAADESAGAGNERNVLCFQLRHKSPSLKNNTGYASRVPSPSNRRR